MNGKTIILVENDKSSLSLYKKITLNVGGFKHEVLWKTLNKVPKSRLGRLINASNKVDMYEFCDGYNAERTEFFFDRDPTLFNYILNYYRIGKLHVSDDICPVGLNNELIYWELDEPLMDLCCEEKLFNKQKEIDHTIFNYQCIVSDVKKKLVQEKKDNSSKYKRMKKKIWDMVDNSFEFNSPPLAKVTQNNGYSSITKFGPEFVIIYWDK